MFTIRSGKMKYKFIVFKKGADSNNLQYEDIIGTHDDLSAVAVDELVNKFIDNGMYQFAEYKIIAK